MAGWGGVEEGGGWKIHHVLSGLSSMEAAAKSSDCKALWSFAPPDGYLGRGYSSWYLYCDDTLSSWDEVEYIEEPTQGPRVQFGGGGGEQGGGGVEVSGTLEKSDCLERSHVPSHFPQPRLTQPATNIKPSRRAHVCLAAGHHGRHHRSPFPCAPEAEDVVDPDESFDMDRARVPCVLLPWALSLGWKLMSSTSRASRWCPHERSLLGLGFFLILGRSPDAARAFLADGPLRGFGWPVSGSKFRSWEWQGRSVHVCEDIEGRLNIS